MKIDLTHVTDAELGHAIRAAMAASKCEQIVALTADKAEIVAMLDEEALALKQKARKERKHLDLKGFTIKGKTVPPLDARDQVLDEIAPALVRSAYNKARYAIGERDLIDPEKATWRFLVIEHIRLMNLGGK